MKQTRPLAEEEALFTIPQLHSYEIRSAVVVQLAEAAVVATVENCCMHACTVCARGAVSILVLDREAFSPLPSCLPLYRAVSQFICLQGTVLWLLGALHLTRAAREPFSIQ